MTAQPTYNDQLEKLIDRNRRRKRPYAAPKGWLRKKIGRWLLYGEWR